MKNKLPVLLLFAVLAGAFITFQLRTVSTVSSPQPVTTELGAQPAPASTSDQVTQPVTSTAAPAIRQPTAVTELEKIFSALPAGPFRDSLIKLTEPDHQRALVKLAGLNVPKEDYPSLRASVGGELYYVCNDLIPPAALAASTTLATTEAAATAAASVPIASPPIRHSKPGSTKILYLDFNGHTITGTSWNSDNGVTTYQAQPYDTDGDPTTFSDAEQTVILEVWSRVAEDYAPFDVDVTTEAPATFTKNTGRALITKSTDANGVSMPSSSAGGVAYLDVFGDSNYATTTSPALIYYNNLAGGTNASYIGEAVSHELGHNLGLSHDGKTDGTAYYTGHGTGETSWAPIMGSCYNKNITQWSKGEYYLANNAEDDLAIISSKLSYRADDAGPTIGTAAALTVSSGSFSTSGLINNSTDVDVYSIALGAGSLTLSVTGFRAASGTDGGNTDIKLELLNSSGTVLATNDPADSTKASLTYTVATAGTYYVRLTPVGTGTPTASTPTGYTSYACIGQYTLTGLGAGTVAPSISTQPASQTVTSGNSVTFSVVASGTPTPTYQWYFNNSAISGATNASYTIVSTTTANAGSYTVTVTNSAGNVTSSAATLTVNVVPAISTQPTSTSITSGNSTTLSVVASGTPAPTYQWYQGTSGTTTSPISGTTSSSFTTPALTATSSYWVRITNSAGSVDSSTATITVNPVTIVPAISTQPASTSITSGNTASLSVVASGTPSPTYQWYQGTSGITTSPISGATTASFTTPTLTASTSYWVRVTNFAGSVDSSTATITVNPVTVVPAISTQPANTSITSGNTATLSVVASGTPSPTYQWYQGTSGNTASLISGATSSSFTTPTLTATASYWVRITNSAGSVDSSTATITVNPVTVVPAISTQPASTSITSGNTATLSIVASGTPAPTYQWYQGTSGTTISPISGATSSFFTTPALTATTSYWVRVSSSAGSVDSSTATITVTTATVAPSISTQPASQTVTAGSSVTFSVVTSGTPTPTYQWYFNNSALSGATSTSYTIASTTTANAGSYTVTVTNSAGNVTSSAATLTVNVIPTISAQPASTAITSGNTATLSVVASGTPAPTYQWYQGTSGSTTSPVSGATSSSFTTPALTVTTSYWVRISNSAGSANSSTATITVNPANVTPTISTQPASQSISPSSTATLNVVASGTPVPTYQWYQGTSGTTTSPISGATTASFTTPTLTASASYWVRVTNSVGSVDSATATITVTTATVAPSISTQPATQTITAGSSVTFSVIASGTPTPTYQWYFNSTAISGATSASYLIASPTTANTGSYTVTVTNSTGSVTSSAATLTVNVVPTISAQPASTSITSGNTTTLGVVASGTPASTYQWYQGPSGTTTSPVSGATSSSFTTPALTVTTSYWVRISNSAGSVNSSTATITVAASVPIITSSILAGGAIAEPFTYTITASNQPTAFSASGLPAGLSLNLATGAITGTPTASGTFSITLGATNASSTGNTTLSLFITPSVAIVTLAGKSGATGASDATAATATFNAPNDIAIDSAGTLYVADTGNHTIRKISLDNTVTTVAGQAGTSGSTNANGTSARFNAPSGIAIDSSGNLYVADTNNHTIRKIDPSANVTTFAGSPGQAGTTDGTGTNARFNLPSDLSFDPSGNLYVADTANHTIRKITSTGVVTTLAGQAGVAGSVNGTGTAAQFSSPADVLAVGTSTLYVADSGNHTIRKISLNGTTATVTTLAGLAGSPGSSDGVGAAARFNSVNGLALGSDGYLYIADTANHVIRRINPADSLVVTLVGAAGNVGSVDGIGASARLDYPLGLAADNSGDVYVADSSSPTIRQLGFYGSPAFATQPAAQTATTGTSVTFTVSANGQPAPIYQWYKDGTALSGASSSSLSISNVQLSNAGSYTVIASNLVGTATSNAAALTITSSGGTSSSSSGSSSSSSSSGSNAGGGAVSYVYLTGLAALCALRRALRKN